MFASQFGQTACVDLLLKNGADINQVDKVQMYFSVCYFVNVLNVDCRMVCLL